MATSRVSAFMVKTPLAVRWVVASETKACGSSDPERSSVKLGTVLSLTWPKAGMKLELKKPVSDWAGRVVVRARQEATTARPPHSRVREERRIMVK